MKTMFWNYIGAASAHFLRHVKELVKKQKPMILCIVETRTHSRNVRKLLKQLYFTDLVVETQGFKGGIWRFWDQNQVYMEFLSGDTQYLSMPVYKGNRVDWVLSLIYVSPDRDEREELWSLFTNVGRGMGAPCCLVSDFNEVVC